MATSADGKIITNLQKVYDKERDVLSVLLNDVIKSQLFFLNNNKITDQNGTERNWTEKDIQEKIVYIYSKNIPSVRTEIEPKNLLEVGNQSRHSVINAIFQVEVNKQTELAQRDELMNTFENKLQKKNDEIKQLQGELKETQERTGTLEEAFLSSKKGSSDQIFRAYRVEEETKDTSELETRLDQSIKREAQLEKEIAQKKMECGEKIKQLQAIIDNNITSKDIDDGLVKAGVKELYASVQGLEAQLNACTVEKDNLQRRLGECSAGLLEASENEQEWKRELTVKEKEVAVLKSTIVKLNKDLDECDKKVHEFEFVDELADDPRDPDIVPEKMEAIVLRQGISLERTSRIIGGFARNNTAVPVKTIHRLNRDLFFPEQYTSRNDRMFREFLRERFVELQQEIQPLPQLMNIGQTTSDEWNSAQELIRASTTLHRTANTPEKKRFYSKWTKSLVAATLVGGLATAGGIAVLYNQITQVPDEDGFIPPKNESRDDEQEISAVEPTVNVLLVVGEFTARAAITVVRTAFGFSPIFDASPANAHYTFVFDKNI